MTPKARHFHLKPKARRKKDFEIFLKEFMGWVAINNLLSSMERIEKQQNKEK